MSVATVSNICRPALLALSTVLLAAAIALSPARAVAAPPPDAPHPIEDRYAATGPHEVATATATDGAGRSIELLFPADLAVGDRHPIVTWGNGSLEMPSKYPGLLRHLASWGYVVVGATTTQAGTGIEILAAVDHLVAAAADPASPFYDALDLHHIAAIGHSQGAGGSVRAAHLGHGLITTVVTVALPNQLFVLPPGEGKEYDTSWLDMPVLFLGGANDQVISGSGTNRAHFEHASGPAATANLLGADHNAIQLTGGGFLGYITAWLEYQRGDADAALAFAGPDPELERNPLWRAVELKGLTIPAPAAASAPAPATTTTSVPIMRPTTTAPSASAAAASDGSLPATGASGAAPVVGVALLVAAAAVRRLLPAR